MSVAKNEASGAGGDRPSPRLVAFYLPQFHPTPQNDRWWGKGFTEWTNVTKAKPLFPGHYQPHLPTDFGFYDLRVRATRRDQIAVARQYGIDAFCYHYYWFSGERLLHEPLDDMLADSDSEMPFCLCWANENWTRRWDAAEHDVLIEQKYLPEDALRFIEDLSPYLRDKRYLRVDGKPLLIIYKAQHLPDAPSVSKVWRAYCRDVGIGEIHLCAALTHGNENYEQYGFDSGVEFPPHNMRCDSVNGSIPFYAPFFGYALQYADIANSFLRRRYPVGSRIFKTVFPSWDNTARTGRRAVVVLNGTPKNYEHWLASTLRNIEADETFEDKLVFINAWNEWAEGCHLEPDRKYGHAFLDATMRAKSNRTKYSEFDDQGLSFPKNVGRSFFRDLGQVFLYHLGALFGKVRNRINRNERLRSVAISIVRGLQKRR